MQNRKSGLISAFEITLYGTLIQSFTAHSFLSIIMQITTYTSQSNVSQQLGV